MSTVASSILVEAIVLAALDYEPLTVRELCECIPVYREVEIKNAMWRLIDRGQLRLTVDRKIALVPR